MKLLGSAIAASQVIDPGHRVSVSHRCAQRAIKAPVAHHQLINHLQHQRSVSCIEFGQLFAEHNTLFGRAVAGLTQEVCKLTAKQLSQLCEQHYGRHHETSLHPGDGFHAYLQVLCHLLLTPESAPPAGVGVQLLCPRSWPAYRGCPLLLRVYKFTCHIFRQKLAWNTHPNN